MHTYLDPFPSQTSLDHRIANLRRRLRAPTPMLCFGRGGVGIGSSTPIPTPSPPAAAAEEEEDHNHSPSASSLNSASTSPNLTINLRREYTLAVHTNSYNEIWSKIHHHHHHDSSSEEAVHSADLIDAVLQPDRSSIQEALSSARFTPLTRLVSDYLHSSERTSHLFLSLRRSVDQARSIYAPIGQLLEILSNDLQLSQSQCDWAFTTFQEFDKTTNPFPAGEPTGSFDGIRCCFLELKQQLDARLVDARRRQRVLRCATHSSAYCLLASAAAAAVSGLVIAAHAMVALATGPALCCCGGGDPLAKQRRRLREHVAQVDTAAREAYVLNNNLDTIERLVARLHAVVESDKGLVRLVLERGGGRGQRHPVQEVVRHLRKNHSRFMHQLRDLDEHIVLCLAAVNRARSLLIQQIHCS